MDKKIGESWLANFSLDVPAPVVRRLVNLGLPVAGMEYEVEKDRVIFDGSLTVTKRGEFLWNGRRITPREFVNIAGLLTYYYPHVVEAFSGLFDLGSVRMVNGVDLKIGNVVVVNAPTARLVDFLYAHNVELNMGFPKTRMPGNVKIVVYGDITVIKLRKGRLTVEIHIDEDVDDLYIEITYGGVYLNDMEEGELVDAVIDGVGIDELMRVAEREVFSSVRVKRVGDYREVSYRGSRVYDFGKAIIRTDGDPLEVYKKVDGAMLDSGWRFRYDGTHGFYWKRIGAMRLWYNGDYMRINFVNGAFVNTVNAVVLMYSNDFMGYLRLLPLL